MESYLNGGLHSRPLYIPLIDIEWKLTGGLYTYSCTEIREYLWIKAFKGTCDWFCRLYIT